MVGLNYLHARHKWGAEVTKKNTLDIEYLMHLPSIWG